MNKKDIKRNNRILFTVSFLIVALFVFGVYGLYYFLTLHTAGHEYAVKSFAGCFNPGKSTWTSYETMTEDEINDSLKQLHLSRKKFEERKDECIRSMQVMSFAGCKMEKYSWKRWNEMNEKEFEDTLKYFDVSEKTFDNIKKTCENHNKYIKNYIR